MEKQLIAETLEQKHAMLIQWLENCDDDLWEKGPSGRWSMGQHIQHLVDSLKMLNKAFKYPNFIVKYKFGTANRPSRSYDEVAKRYQEKLNANRDRAREFNKSLRFPTVLEKPKLIISLDQQAKILMKTSLKLSDKKLDLLLLPHPLMGRMTFREIIMWTAYHTEHHFEILKKDYSS